MTAFLIALLILVSLLGLVLIVLGLPGTLLILLAAGGYALLRPFSAGTQHVLLMLAGLSVAAELLEYGITYFVARKAKVPKDIVAASILGGVIGAMIGVPIAIVGSLIGMYLGVALGAFGYAIYKERNARRAWTLTKASLISRTLAIAAKALMGVFMLGYMIWSL